MRLAPPLYLACRRRHSHAYGAHGKPWRSRRRLSASSAPATRALYHIAQVAFAYGIFLWLVYGLRVGNWLFIAANLATLPFMLVIICMKPQFGQSLLTH
ncbi:MAG: hypothetical protein KF735_01945 [Chelatococcus sp.]|uniref:hypothetical protein n=1 Tax=Chelatococcus sp. TaxID=1953771 RepID=UPI0025BD8233|nr:hypothetical protein [Chelatococcus sp.]MBX3536374.1 hypothetical protein [Chelatococcus sp.]